MKDHIWERCYPLPLTCRAIVRVISRRTGKLGWCFTLISDPVISVPNLSVFPLTVISLEVTFRWTSGLVWVISTVRTEITHFVDIDAVYISILTPDKQMKANSDSTTVKGLKFGEKDTTAAWQHILREEKINPLSVSKVHYMSWTTGSLFNHQWTMDYIWFHFRDKLASSIWR